MAVLSFDLDEDDDYATAYEKLAELGFEAVTPSKGIDLPSTTVIGQVPAETKASELRDAVWLVLQRAGLHPTRLLGGILENWATRTG